MKQNFTVRQAAPDGVDAFLSVGQHRNFRKAAEELGVTPSVGSPDYLRVAGNACGSWVIEIRRITKLPSIQSGSRVAARSKTTSSALRPSLGAQNLHRQGSDRKGPLTLLYAPQP
jgi:hypothetical protein